MGNRSASSPHLEELLRGRVAHAVMRSIVRDLAVQLHSSGKPFPTWAKPVLEALQEASGEALPDALASAIGRAPVTVDSTVWLSSPEAARAVGRSERQIRRLASSGQVRARRVGERAWQIDRDSLTNVLRRAQ